MWCWFWWIWERNIIIILDIWEILKKQYNKQQLRMSKHLFYSRIRLLFSFLATRMHRFIEIKSIFKRLINLHRSEINNFRIHTRIHTRMLSILRSRWMSPRLWMYDIACEISIIIFVFENFVHVMVKIFKGRLRSLLCLLLFRPADWSW